MKNDFVKEKKSRKPEEKKPHVEKRKFKPSDIIVHLLLLILVFVNLFPLYWMLTFSLKSKGEIIGYTVEAPQTKWEEVETAIKSVIGDTADIEWGALHTVINTSIGNQLTEVYRKALNDFPSAERNAHRAEIEGNRDRYIAELQGVVDRNWDAILEELQAVDGILSPELNGLDRKDPAREPVKLAAEAVVTRWLQANLPFSAETEANAEPEQNLIPGDGDTRLPFVFSFSDQRWKRFCQATDRIVNMQQAGIADPWEGVKSSLALVMGDQANTLDQHEITKIPPNNVGLPRDFAFENYANAMSGGNMLTLFANSIIVTVVTILITIAASFMSTYAITRLVWKGRKLMNKFFMLGLTIPIHAALVPVYIIMNRIGLIGNHLPWPVGLLSLIIPYSAFSLAMGILISIGFMGDIPYDLDEAAFLDGCGVWGIFFRVILPLMMPAISTIGIYTFLQCWNELLLATVYISRSDLYTLPVGINTWASTQTSTADWGKIGAGLVIATAPTLIVYILLSKKIQAGFIAGAVKG